MSSIFNPLIFLVDDDQAFRRMIDAYLKQHHLTRVRQFSSSEEMFERFSKEKPVIVIQDFDLGPGKLNGIETLSRAKSINPQIDFIFLSGQSSIEVAVEAIKKGAYDYVIKDEYAKESLLNRIKKNIFQERLVRNQKYIKIAGIIFAILIALILFICHLAGVRLMLPDK